LARLASSADVRYVVHMIHVSFSELRRRLAHFMDRAVDDRAPVLVTRQGHEPVVMMAQSDYDGLMETLHLKSSLANWTRLNEAIAEAERGEGIEVVWDEDARAYKPR
jgi:antitoxin YefM